WSIIGDRKELTIYGAHISGLEGYEVAIRTLADRSIDVKDIVTHQFALKDWKQAFDLAYAGDESIKVVLIPDMD
ncbi:MAG: erythritol/L-threitol dehydrogenase, partial [Firmicutes bacterium]|nr:erythritol/L-threitol dehydrogenase [Bacillota bacterium]